MDANRTAWNQRQKELRQLLEKEGDLEQGREMFHTQHALLHVAAEDGAVSFAGEVWHDTPEAIIRRVPRNCEHSIAWCFWHMARIEDLAMSWLVAGEPQLVEQADWFERMKIDVRHTGNAMSIDEIRTLSDVIDLDALFDYRQAVGRQTHEIVQQLKPAQLRQSPDPARLQQVLDQGWVIERGIVDYWSKRTIAGLLLMPPTRHNFVHLNEAQRLKQRKA